MKKIIVAIMCLVCCAPFCMAQDYDEETGVRYFRNEQYSTAVPYLQRAAKAGSARAQDFLGYMYECGLGVEKNYKIAMNLYVKAEAANYGPGIVSIGRLYEKGLGVPKSQEKAFAYYKKAADIGCAEGEYQTGLGYIFGKGTEKNPEQAFEYIRRCTTGGYGWEELGDMYCSGFGTSVDYQKAFECYTHEKRDYYSKSALKRLAEMYHKGIGTSVDYDRALEILGEMSDEEARSAYVAIKQEKEEAERAARVVTAPGYPGGTQALYAFLRKNMRKPQIAIESAGYGTTTVQFVVTSNGEVTGANYKRRCNARVDEEVLRLVNMTGGWQPATKGGRPCNSIVQISMSIFPSFSASAQFVGVVQ